ncbi:MAG: YihY family inner membrane protein [Bacteroidales bacterium]|nr:YihY family inner membrane protein [Bacteroidales bacterium]
MKKNIVQQVTQFFETDIWKISTKDKHPVFSFFVRLGKIFFIAIKGFRKDKIQIRASALSFYTLLSLVPLLAMVFAIAQGFGIKSRLNNILTERLVGQEELLNVLLGFVDKYLGHINSGYIAGIGILILFWSVLKVMGNIESSFNNIWQVKKSRIISRQFTDYISILVIAPVFLIIASSFNVSQLQSISSSIPFLHYLDSVLRVLVTILSYTLIWIVFTIIYIIVPNTRVKFVPALIGGIIAGTMFQLLQWGYVNFQSKLTSYGAVYGTFAALPLLMMWLEFSWLIVLLGAEISYAYQNAAHYEQESEDIQVSPKQRRVLELLIAQKIITNFAEGNDPLNSTDIADQLGIPARVVRDILYDLLGARIIIETLTHEVREVGYQPATDPAKLTVSYIVEALDKKGQEVSFDKESKEFGKLSKVVDSFYDDLLKSPNNKTLRDI